MKLTRDNFQQLLTPIHKGIIYNAYNEKETQYDKVFKVETMRKATETFVHLGAFGAWAENTEGNTIGEDEMNEGDTVTFTARRFDKGYSVTWELTKDDLYGVLAGKGKGGSAKELGAGLRRTIEQDCADVINNGFANTGYDGVALFSNSHPLTDSASLLDNLVTGACTPANVKLALTNVRNQVDQAGNKIQAVGKELIGGPDSEFTILEILGSSNQAFELSNTTNVKRISGMQPRIMDYITGDTWGVRDPSFDNLIYMWREMPFYDSQLLPKTVDFFMFGYCRMDSGYKDIRGICFSQGA